MKRGIFTNKTLTYNISNNKFIKIKHYMNIDKRIEVLIDEIIRVNHAGESGAKQIYKYQAKALKSENDKNQIKAMLSQELVHLEYFDKIGKELQIRPTLMSLIWNIGASSLGVITGKIGIKAVMSCTAGVEKVIQKHYECQLLQIDDFLNIINQDNKYYKILQNLKHNIEIFLQDEKEHYECGNEYINESMMFNVIKETSSVLTKFAVFISTKI